MPRLYLGDRKQAEQLITESQWALCCDRTTWNTGSFFSEFIWAHLSHWSLLPKNTKHPVIMQEACLLIHERWHWEVTGKYGAVSKKHMHFWSFRSLTFSNLNWEFPLHVMFFEQDMQVFVWNAGICNYIFYDYRILCLWNSCLIMDLNVLRSIKINYGRTFEKLWKKC